MNTLIDKGTYITVQDVETLHQYRIGSGSESGRVIIEHSQTCPKCIEEKNK